MKIKLVIVDWEIPPRLKKWGLRMGLPLAMLLGGSAAAWAAGLRTWNPGDTLLAADLNGNFASLDARVAALEGPTSKVSLHDVSSFVLPANVDGTQFVVVPYAMKTVD